MTVEELIKELQKHDPKRTVLGITYERSDAEYVNQIEVDEVPGDNFIRIWFAGAPIGDVYVSNFDNTEKVYNKGDVE